MNNLFFHHNNGLATPGLKALWHPKMSCDSDYLSMSENATTCIEKMLSCVPEKLKFVYMIIFFYVQR